MPWVWLSLQRYFIDCEGMLPSITISSVSVISCSNRLICNAEQRYFVKYRSTRRAQNFVKAGQLGLVYIHRVIVGLYFIVTWPIWPLASICSVVTNTSTSTNRLMQFITVYTYPSILYASCFYFVKLVKYCVCQCFNKELLTYLLTYLLILTLIFKYLLWVFKYLTIAYNNHPVKNMHCHQLLCAY